MPRNLAPVIDWEAIRRDFPCPPALWQGVWATVAAQCGEGWDVWSATYSALSALAARSLHWYYYKAPLYGMSYVLNIAPTGAGKEFGIDIVSALLPPDYNQRDAIQSGQALFPILADTTSQERIKPARPTILVINEWTKLISLGGIQHSTLVETLNSIFHRSRSWNMSRSDRDTASGLGGDRICAPPALSIYGATTPEALLIEVTSELVNRGFLNRYLILPGPTAEWEFWPKKTIPADPAVALAPIQEALSALRTHTWGSGRNYQEAFSPTAQKRIEPWGVKQYTALMQQSSTETNRKKRLHFYAHHIALLSAWSKQASQVEQEDVEMAISVVEASQRFIDILWAEDTIPITTMEAGDARLERLILDRIAEKPDYFDTYRLRSSLRRQWTGLSVGKLARILTHLIQSGDIVTNPSTRNYVTRDQIQRDGKGSFVLTGKVTTIWYTRERIQQLLVSVNHQVYCSKLSKENMRGWYPYL